MFVMAQSQRLVLLEHFTQASCGPCATYNPAVQAILAANPDKITYIKYQTSWPGYDPMNLHNPTEVASRVGYYGVSGVPHSILDGNYYDGSASGWNVGTVNARYAVSTPIEIQLQHSLSAAQDSVHVTMLVKATGPVSGNLVAMIGVVEKHIAFTTAPGSNGEKNFYNVMKKFLPNALGNTLPASMVAGDYVIFRHSWKLANFYNLAQLGVVGWVQNRTTKEVLQAANSTTNPIVPLHANDGALRTILGIGDSWCGEDVAPSVIIRNQGSQALTSAEIAYSVNGGAIATQSWTGNLEFLGEATITLPSSSFNLSLDNHLRVYINSVNGVSDNFTYNDTLGRSFGLAPGTSEKVYLYLKTDNFPQQTSWSLADDLGNVIETGGPYTQSGQVIQKTWTLNPGCYTFTLRDAAGNGICCTNGYGVYQLTSDVTGQVLGEGDNFGYEGVHSFKVGGYSGMNEGQAFTNPVIFPNPASTEALIGLTLNEPATVELSVTDLHGRPVMKRSVVLSNPGEHQLPVMLDDLEDGLYVVRLKCGSQESILKLNVIH
jgi:hypothetical protein